LDAEQIGVAPMAITAQTRRREDLIGLSVYRLKANLRF
jgi:hypothetical protein